MKITAAITSMAKSKTCSATASAVSLEADGFKHARVIPFTKATVNQAELFAFCYILSSVKADVSDVDFEITTSNAYVERMLKRDEHGQFLVKPELNLELVKSARELIAKRPRVTINVGNNDQTKALKDAIKKALVTADAK